MLQPVFSSHLPVPMLWPLFGGQRKSPLIQNSKTSPASDQFVRRVDKAIKVLPKYFRDAWKQAGGMVYTGEFMTGIHPDWQDDPDGPRGWEKEDSWDNVDGVCQDKKVSMAEYTWREKKETRKKPSRFEAGDKYTAERFYDVPLTEENTREKHKLSKLVQPGRVLRHEAGHALDEFFAPYANKVLSESRMFKQAYRKDIANLNEQGRKEWYYYIQPDKLGRATAAGRSEIFAESFAALYGGGCDKVRYIRKYFGNSMACMEDILRRLEQKQRRKNRH